MSLNETVVEYAAMEWFKEMGYAVGMGRISRPVNRRRSGIRLARWSWWNAFVLRFGA